MRLDTDDYIGIPFKTHGRGRDGCDCWGLVRLVYLERLGIELPSFSDSYQDAQRDVDGVAAELRAQAATWRKVELDQAQPGDVLVWQRGGQPTHVGLVVSPADRLMLHTESRCISSCLERYDRPPWDGMADGRLFGCYRYNGNRQVVVGHDDNSAVEPLASRKVRVFWRSSLLAPTMESSAVDCGVSLAELIARFIDPRLWPFLRVHIGDDHQAIPRRLWPRVRPKPGVQVHLLPVPQGGGGGDGSKVVRSVLMLSVVAGAILLPAYAPALGLAAIASGTTGGAFASAAIGVIGSLAVNALVPVQAPRLADGDGLAGVQHSIRGVDNQLNPWGIVPMPLGRIRVVPPLGARPYTERVGSEQYVRIVVIWGIGPLTVEDIRIGETPLADLPQVQVQHRWNPGVDAPLALFPAIVNENRFSSLEITSAGGWYTQTTVPGVNEMLLEIACPSGLKRVSSNGRKQDPYSVTLQYRYRPVGGSFAPTVSFTITGETTEPIFHTVRITDLPPDTYEIQLRRVTTNVPSQDQGRIQDRTFWTMLQAFEPGDPIRQAGAARSAFRIRARDVADGQISISGIVTPVGLDWNGVEWVPQQKLTNPASLFRWVAQNKHASAAPKTNAQLDLPALQSWHTRCRKKGWKFAAVIDFEASLQEVLSRIAAVGRASFYQAYNRLGIVQDRSDLPLVQAYTPRNMTGTFRLSREFVQLPHALRVRFVNEEIDFQQDEIIVYNDGYAREEGGGKLAAVVFETVEAYGITNPVQAYSWGRRMLALIVQRPERAIIPSDWEYLAAPLGSRIRVQHDAVLWGLGSGRVISRVLQAGNSECVSVTLDERIVLDGTPHVMRIRRSTGVQLVHPLANFNGETDTFTFSPVLTEGFPAVGDMVMVGKTNLESVDLVVAQIQPTDGWDGANLVCVAYAPELESADDEIGDFDPRITVPRVVRAGAAPRLPAPRVASVRSDESVLSMAADGSWIPAIVIVLEPHDYSTSTLVRTEITWSATTSATSRQILTIDGDGRTARITGVRVGVVYRLQLRHIFREAYGANAGRLVTGPATTLEHRVVGATDAPDPVEGLFQDGDYVRWAAGNTAPDHAGWEIRGASESDMPYSFATRLHDGLLTEASFPIARCPRDFNWVFVVAYDRSGLHSSPPAKLQLQRLPSTSREPVLSVSMAADDWRGTLTGGSRVADPDKLPALVPELLSSFFSGDDTARFFSGATDSPFFRSVYAEMIYETSWPMPTNLREGDAVRIVVDANTTHRLEVRWTGDSVVQLIDIDDAIPVTGSALDDPLFIAAAQLDEPILVDAVIDATPWVTWRGEVLAVPDEILRIRLTVPGGSLAFSPAVDDMRVELVAFERIEVHHNVNVLATEGRRVVPRQPFRRILWADASLHDTLNKFVRRVNRDPLRDATDGPMFSVYTTSDPPLRVEGLIDVRMAGV